MEREDVDVSSEYFIRNFIISNFSLSHHGIMEMFYPGPAECQASSNPGSVQGCHGWTCSEGTGGGGESNYNSLLAQSPGHELNFAKLGRTFTIFAAFL